MNDYDQILCGHCRQTVQVPQDRGVERCQCGSYVYRRDVSLDAVRQYVEQCEGPLSHHGQFTPAGQRPVPFNPVMRPADVLRDSHEQFGPEPTRGLARETFYAQWSAYDAALGNMPLPQQDLQRKAEILELERLVGL